MAKICESPGASSSCIEPGGALTCLSKAIKQLASEAYLVGGWATPLKNMKVNWDDEIPNIWKNKKYSKPPTRYPTLFRSSFTADSVGYLDVMLRCLCSAQGCLCHTSEAVWYAAKPDSAASIHVPESLSLRQGDRAE